MVGVKGRSGGARPGAGRKRQDTVVVQRNRRDVVLEVVTESEWRRTVKAWLVLAQTTPSVLYPLLPYLLGAAKQEVNVTGQIEHVRIAEIRHALGIPRPRLGTKDAS